MICYRCGAKSETRNFCPNCNTDLSLIAKTIRLSNAYYNDGLSKASVRNLSSAIVSLQRSLKLYKYNTNARNLLGLVYYEMGEIVDAISEWTISLTYQPKNNHASTYMEAFQNNPGKWNEMQQNIRKYNQALIYCHQGSRDLALIQIKKVLAVNPALVKGYQLLALLYLQDNKLEQAKRALRAAGKIDTNNTTTLRYLKEVNQRLKEKGKDKNKKNDDLISYQSGNEMIIMPKRFKESSLGSSMLCVLGGIVVGIACTAWLIVPAVKDNAQEEARKQVLEASELIAENGQTITALEKEIEGLEAQIEEISKSAQTEDERVLGYQKLFDAYEKYRERDYLAAGKALEEINSTLLEGAYLEHYNTLFADVKDKYMMGLYEEGYNYYKTQKYQDAIVNFLKLVEEDMGYNDGMAAYHLAQSYRKNGEFSQAKKYYQYIIDNYPNTERAQTAQKYLEEEE